MRSQTRSALAAVAAVTAVALAGCSGQPGDEGSQRLVVGSFGGDYDTHLKTYVDPLFRAAADGTEIFYSSGDTATLRTKLVAESGTPRGTFDVVQLGDKDIPLMLDEDVLMELDPSRISNWENIRPELRHDYCIPHIYSPVVITYNPEVITDPIEDWDDFYGNESVIAESGQWDRWADYMVYGASVMEAGGDPGEEVLLGLDIAADAAAEMRPYGSATQIGTALMTGEINALVSARANAADWSNRSGKDFVSVVPGPGTRAVTFYSCIPANTQNVDAAYDYLNAQLDPSAQQGFAEAYFFAPTVTNAELSAELGARVGVSAEEEPLLLDSDIAALSRALPEISERWAGLGS